MVRLSERATKHGLEQGLEKGIEKGMEALISTCRAVGVSWIVTMGQLKEKFDMPEERAGEKMKLYWGN